MFLTETTTRHSLLTKHKHFREKMPEKLQSNSMKLIGETNNSPVLVDDIQATIPGLLLEEDSGDDSIHLTDIPQAHSLSRSSKRLRNHGAREIIDDDSSQQDQASEMEAGPGDQPPQAKKLRVAANDLNIGPEDGDDKKKLAMDVSYDGFAIYGRVLCLVVKKRESKTSQTSTRDSGPAGSKPSGHARMENWITSTQIPAGEDGL